MSERSPSRTAIGVAYVRATHQLLEPDALVLRDPVALAILGPRAEEGIRAATERARSEQSRRLRSHVVLRSRVAEERLEASLARGVQQYVLVGAGLDTFAFRQPPWATSLRIVEVDRGETQEYKRIAAQSAALGEPPNLQYVTIDFECETLCDGLARAGVARDVPTFFSWLGVTMYLTGDAIDQTLRCMTSFPPQSEAVITFLPPFDEGTTTVAGIAASLGEPFVSTFTPEEFDAKLRKAGFSQVEMLTPEMSAKYFPPEGLAAPRRTTIAMAIV